ncbi:MAG: dinitrogenase iron-molybdenum cofactor biosynthesis protein [Deltaproteobacteria bacterium]|nr:MAG: dinitrogenase iron-molybdenum cofactor biosynthesis protein [Deltaproteobacteria bacterium]
MKIVITSTGNTLDSPIDPRFGRCQFFIFVDPDTMDFEAVENQAMMAAGGAGPQAAQFVTDKGAEAIITGNVGPNAASSLAAAGLKIYVGATGTVRETINRFKTGQLQEVTQATVGPHAGLGGGMGRGDGRRRW